MADTSKQSMTLSPYGRENKADMYLLRKIIVKDEMRPAAFILSVKGDNKLHLTIPDTVRRPESGSNKGIRVLRMEKRGGRWRGSRGRRERAGRRERGGEEREREREREGEERY